MRSGLSEAKYRELSASVYVLSVNGMWRDKAVPEDVDAVWVWGQRDAYVAAPTSIHEEKEVHRLKGELSDKPTSGYVGVAFPGEEHAR